MRENELLRHIFERSKGLSTAFPRVVVGPGDDCAVVNATGQLLLKVDQLIEGRHFTPETPIDLIARKAIARAVSDIAAMAGRPVASLAAAMIPAGYPHADALFDAAARWARHWGCPLVGGDIARVARAQEGGRLGLSITVLGEAHRTRGPVLRSGARVGDLVFVTGEIGGSFDAGSGGGRHLTFEPRLAEAAWLAENLGERLHAMMDVSDGLGMDAGRLAAASGVRIDIDGGAIPLSPAVEGVGGNWLQAIRDGEDYELLFTSDPGASVPEEIPGTAARVTRIGVATPGSGCFVKGVDGRVIDASAMGFEHA
ncbi:MAG: thiamine-phosphate kinase [Planctomycetota bacterium]